jgi:amino acid transporter
VLKKHFPQLDEVFKTPELLATLLFSAFFIFCPNSDGNSIEFAKHVLLSYTPEAKSTKDLNKSMITLLAILVLTFVCLIHYFSRNSGLFLNKIFAIYKICFVSSLIIAGFNSARLHPGPALKDWNNSGADPKASLTALIYVLYSYQGWENANYVRPFL